MRSSRLISCLTIVEFKGRREGLYFVNVNGCAMCFGQEGIDLITFGVETQRMSAALCLNRFDWFQDVGVKDVDSTRISNCDVQMPQYPVEEDYVGRTAEFELLYYLARIGLQNDQPLGVTGAKQAALLRVKIKSMWSGNRNCNSARNPIWLTRSQDHDLRGDSDVYVKNFALGVEYGPAGPTWHANTAYHPLVFCVHK